MSDTSRPPHSDTSVDRAASAHLLDPRGLRVVAGITAVVLAVVLLTGNPVILGVQVIVFAIGVLLGPRQSPYSLIYARLVRPRLGPPGSLEEEAPPRFAQGVGFAFTLVALAAYLAGATTLGAVATGLALVAAFLNAAFGLCLGCEAYLLARRVLTPTSKEVSA